MIKFRQFKPPGVYLSDIRKYTGYQDIVGACRKANVKLLRLRGREYNTISLQETKRVLMVIRSIQGERLLRTLDKQYDIDGGRVKKKL